MQLYLVAKLSEKFKELSFKDYLYHIVVVVFFLHKLWERENTSRIFRKLKKPKLFLGPLEHVSVPANAFQDIVKPQLNWNSFFQVYTNYSCQQKGHGYFKLVNKRATRITKFPSAPLCL